jgi:mRNA guanylyltransferase
LKLSANSLYESYYVCEKSDGIRYLLYLTTDEEGRESHYLIDRKNDYWWIQHRNLHFPLKDNDEGFHTNALIDGELVMDDLGDGRKEPRFLVFDCLVLDGRRDLLSRPLDKRLGYFRELIMSPYKDLFTRYPAESRYQAFKVEMKDMQVAYGIEMMFRQVLPNLKHGNDGLIFTCRNSEYRHGTDQNILKWKPVTENTIDFRLRLRFHTVEPDEYDRADGVNEPYVDYDGVPDAELWVYAGDNRAEPYMLFKPLYLTEDEWDTLKTLGDPLNDRIVECAMDEQGRWRLHRFRDDKAEANHTTTVNSVMQSIDDSVSEQELLDAAKGIKDSWKARAAKQR